MKRTKQLNQIAKAIREFYKSLKNEFNAILESEGFTNGEFLLLKSIALSGNKKISEIAKELCVTMPYLTSLADKMVKKKYLERIQSKEDRRIVIIRLTPKGIKIYSKLDAVVHKYLEKKFDKLTNQELETFEKLLQKVSNLT
ncbi:MAG: MarR family transcriptional regulator [Leptospiraceae bacterium]|nr:MarR family transcriptional regulator [Leptospiraceae bacterium]